jgi:3-deoxy-manno-octulosonate cytidylyltransferase (CMP-KDO synthetase)
MSVIAIIPARYQSTRFPGKPLVDIKGKSMIQRVWEIASSVGCLDRVIIATDDSRIFDHAKSFGAEVMMTSKNHINGTERIAEVIRLLPQEYDYVLNIQGDEPFLIPSQIESLCGVISSEDFKIATLIKKLTSIDEIESPNVVKVVKASNGKALYFSRYPIPYNRQNDDKIMHYKHIGMYAFKSNILQDLISLPLAEIEKAESLEQLRWLDAGYDIGVELTDYESVGIDTPDDLQKAIQSL